VKFLRSVQCIDIEGLISEMSTCQVQFSVNKVHVSLLLQSNCVLPLRTCVKYKNHACGLMRESTAARLRRLRVRIPPEEAWMSVSCECCVLSGRGLCDGLVTRPEESYRL
jgi:hypothetical protein